MQIFEERHDQIYVGPQKEKKQAPVYILTKENDNNDPPIPPPTHNKVTTFLSLMLSISIISLILHVYTFNIVHFHCCIVLPCINIPQFTYSSFCQWTFGLFLTFCYKKKYSHEYSCLLIHIKKSLSRTIFL